MSISINYVLRTDKTETRLTSGIYCIPEIALEQMNETKELWGKTDGRQYKHFVQSFPESDDVLPEVIHAIGVRFAERMFPGFEVLVSTHKDKSHCHTHFVVNSVNLENGLKIQNDYHALKAMRDYSDELCREYGLSVLDEWSYANKGKSHDKQSEEIARRAVEGKFKSHKFDCYRAVLAAVAVAVSREDFISQMNQSGWAVEWSDNKKHITFINHENPKQKNRYSTLAKEHKTYSDTDILGEHDPLPFAEDFKAELLARFAQNAERIEPVAVVPIAEVQPEKSPPAITDHATKRRYMQRVEELKLWISAAEQYKSCKPFNDELERLKSKPKNIFNRKAVEHEIWEYESRHAGKLSSYIGALSNLPEGKPNPTKWRSELKKLQDILNAQTKGRSIQGEIRESVKRNRKREVERERSQPERKKSRGLEVGEF